MDLFQLLVKLELVDYVAPVQLSIRLLIPEGSRLLDLPMMKEHLLRFDGAALCYQWCHPDPSMDLLHDRISRIVETGEAENKSRLKIFSEVCHATHEVCGLKTPELFQMENSGAPIHVPCLSEPWYCCAEPTESQLSEF